MNLLETVVLAAVSGILSFLVSRWCFDYISKKAERKMQEIEKQNAEKDEKTDTPPTDVLREER